MSLADAAQHVQSMGRGTDSMLIHMSPREIAGLQALAEQHGGTLTINPETGLPEAGFLEDILPMIAGVVLSATGVGAIASGLIVGGATAAISGDLQKGLIAGLGAYGGAGVGSGLAAAGTAATTAAAEAAAARAATTGAARAGATGMMDDAAMMAARGGANVSAQLANSYTQAAAQGVGQRAAQGAAQGALQNAGAAQARTIAASNVGLRQPAAQMTGVMPPPTAPTPTSTLAQNSLDQLKMMGKGFGQLGEKGGAGMLSDLAIPAGAAMLPMLQGQQAKGQMEEEEYEPTNPFIKKRLSPNFNGFVPPRPQPYYIPTGLGYARGGVTRARRLTSSDIDELPDYAPPGMYYGEGIMPELDPADEAAQRQVQGAFAQAKLKAAPLPKHVPIAMAGGGLSAGLGRLGGYSDGGRLLKGPGDGMSDNIPAHVGGEQPVRLADGEFVVSADVVSGLGNGSTDAGAKKLYEMMAKVREARTGKKKQAPAIKADKLLPA